MTRAGPFQHVSAGGMSLLVHGFLLAFLLYSVSWRSLPHQPVEAELWSALPEPPAPLPVLPPEPKPAPEPSRETAKPEVAKPVVAKPEVAKPDIALERAEKKRREKETLEKEALEKEALQRQEAARQAELQRQAEEQARLEKEKAAQAEKLRQAQQREQARQQMLQELDRQAHQELDAEDSQLRVALRRQQASASRAARLIDEAQERIRDRIRSYLRLPQNLVGNPEAMFRVILLPNGEVLRATLLRGSGQPSYDDEVERAILKASPLPLPSDPDARAAFRDGLILKFRPREDAIGGG
jgi:colicin import membrane protein